MKFNDETGQTLISGMGELHLEIIVDRLTREFNVGANVGKPQVAYRETIRKPVHKVEAPVRRARPAAAASTATSCIDLEPTGPGGGYEFVNKIVGGSIPREYIPAVDQGIQEAMESGVLAGYPLVDVRATLIDGSYHEVDSSEMAFKIAGQMALREGARKADPVLLEPVMEFEVITPEEFMGDVMGDVTSRRGRIEHIDERAGHAGDPRARAARRAVRLRDRPAVEDPGPRRAHARCSCTRTGGSRADRQGDRRAGRRGE